MVAVNILGAKLLLKQLRAPRYKKPYTVAIPPPWSRLRMYLRGRPATIVKVNEAFATAATQTAKMSLADRMEIIGDVLRGASFGGKKRVIYARVSPSEREAKKAAIKAALGLVAAKA